MRNTNAIVLTGPDTSTQTGSQIDANQIYAASFVAYFGDTSAVGTFKIQASNDVLIGQNIPNSTAHAATHWADIPSATMAISAGGSAVITLPNVCYRWLRAVYVFGSGGTTTVTVAMNSLGF